MRNSEIITESNYPDIYNWLKDVISILNPITSSWEDICFKNNHNFTLKENKINVVGRIVIKKQIKKLKYPFGIIYGDIYCADNTIKNLDGFPLEVIGNVVFSKCEKLLSLKKSPINICGDFDLTYCNNLKSLIGFPKIIRGTIMFINHKISNNPKDKGMYINYVDMWLELLESVSDDDKLEYINNYKDKTNWFGGKLIIPKEVINQYKIDFLLK